MARCWLAAFVLFACVLHVIGDQITITTIIRDVWPCEKAADCGKYTNMSVTCNPAFCNKEFERSSDPKETGIIRKKIGSDRKPWLSPEAPTKLIDGGEGWQWWYNTAKGRNIAFAVNLTLDNTNQKNKAIFGYENNDFFPLTGTGFGNYYNNRNFHFTLELHSRFVYRGNEVFNFKGDDDVWVFINDQLVIDLSGTGGTQSASVTLNKTDIGLVVGKSYSFDFFFAERKITESTIKIETSIDLTCSVVDRCGECFGDGQSCCSCPDDGDACTIERCNPYNGECLDPIPRECPGDPTNQCKKIGCTKTGGCNYTDVVCNKGNACNTPTCNPSTGCTYPPITCDDKNACTSDSCDPVKGCQFTPLNCNDTQPTGCYFYGCNPDGVGCTAVVNPCRDDLNSCRIGQCVGRSCQWSDRQCNNPDPACNTVSCDPKNGCVVSPISCVDDDPCTNDVCTPGIGCEKKQITCDDKNACTDDTCIAGVGCNFATRNCSDGMACTTDLCNNSTGCYYETLSCNDGNACTIDSCDNSTGCNSLEKDCSDIYPCTNDTCNTVTGLCSHTQISPCPGCGGFNCDQETTDPCNPMVCNPGAGRCEQQAYKGCGTGNKCNWFTCSAVNGKATCVPQSVKCTTTDVCKPKRCSTNNGSCIEEPVDCDDRNPCTADSCYDLNGVATCNNTYIPSPRSTPCDPFPCDPNTGEYKSAPVNCDDKNDCTDDTCENVPEGYKCKNQLITCNSTSACLPQSCVDNQCQVFAVDCSDGNPCSIDTPISHDNGTCECAHEPKCNTVDLCNPITCNAANDGACETNPVDCDDSNPCTDDKCEEGKCIYTDVSAKCDDGNACTLDECRPDAPGSGCVNSNISCGASNQCQDTFCDPQAGCITKQKVFDPVPVCKVGYCDPLQGWLVTDRECNPKSTCKCVEDECVCAGFFETTAGKVSAGVIAGVVIGVAAFVIFAAIGGKKGFDYYKASSMSQSEIKANPLYVDDNQGFDNPMFEENMQ